MKKQPILKRLSAMSLCLCLMMGLLPVRVLATDTQPAEDTPVCICETLCTEGDVNTECPVCSAEGADLNQCTGTSVPDTEGGEADGEPDGVDEIDSMIADVQALIDALPMVAELESMGLDEQQLAYDQVQVAYSEYNALTDEQKEQITGAEIFDSLFAVFNGMVGTLTTTTNVSYIDAAGQEQQTTGTVTIVDGTMTEWTAGWYVVDSNIAISSRITVTGAVHLILSDGVTLTASAGITVSGGSNSLTVYGQSAGTGKLIATSTAFGNAGIGGEFGADGNNITINGGIIEAEGGDWGAGIGGGFLGMGKNIVINGGNVKATSGEYAAGIGGGFYDQGEASSDITINGGTVIAQGSTESAGIGTGRGGVGPLVTAIVNINGGNITATSGERGTGIGGGINCNAVITITGGVIDATGGDSGAGIGSGYYNVAGEEHSPIPTITITGGTITASGGNRQTYGSSTDRYSGAGAAIGYSGSVIYQYGAYRGPRDGEESASYDDCLIFKKSHDTENKITGQVYGEYTLSDDVKWPEEQIELEITKDAILYIPTGQTIPDTVTLTGEGEISPKMEATVQITATLDKEYDGNAVSLNSSGYTYTGDSTAPAITITWHSNNDDGTIGNVLDTAPSALGTYWVKVSAAATNFYAAAEATKQFTISPITLDTPTNLTFSSNAPGQAVASWNTVENAAGYSVQLYRNGQTQGTPVSIESGNTTSYQFSITEAGRYTFQVKATGSNVYSDSAAAESPALTWYSITINEGINGSAAAVDSSGNSISFALSGTEITLTPSPDTDYHFGSWTVNSGGVTVSESNGIYTFTVGSQAVDITPVFEACSGGSASYFQRAVCTTCGKEYGSLLTDETMPEGTITLGTNSWKSFLNTITFGLFFKDTQTVEISATDDSYSHAGYTEDKAVKVEYYLHNGEEALTKSTLDEIAFTEYTGKLTIEPTSRYVIYVRLTDHAGNADYISSDGIVLDGTAPTRPTVGTSGYTSGGWTNGDVEFTISGSTALSGIKKYQYSTDDGASWTDLTITEGSASLNVSAASTDANGTTYLFRAVSNSGVEGIESDTVTVKIDKTEPTIDVSGETTKYLQKDIVDIKATAGVSDIAKVTASKDNGEPEDITESYQSGYKVEENGTYAFTVTNGAGVTATDRITYTNIDRATPVVVIDSNGYTGGAWTNSDVTLSVSNSTANLGDTKFEYRVGDGAWQTYSSPITVSEDTIGTTYTFRATSASEVRSDEVSITVRLDKIAPDGDIKIEENSVKTFINTITFDLFYNENVDVSITSEDAGSGVQSTWYYHSEDILTEEQVAALTDADWTAYTDTIGVTAVDADTFVYYVKIIDSAGNTTCFASNGATFDLTNPVISGVTNGETYYTTQKVQVTDDNLSTVTLDGATVDSEITLDGNTSTDYTIVATDKAGNEITVKVTMRETQSLSEALGDITTGNVTSGDQETIEDYLDDLNTRLEDENLTDEEKEIIQGLVADAQDLLDKIEEAAQAANTENIQQAQNITADKVTPADKEVLEAAKEDMEKALAEYGGNYTEEERAKHEETLKQIEEALAVIQRIEAVEEAIAALPDSVSPDDTEAEGQIDAAKELYDGLSEYEKSLVSAEAADKLESLLAQLVDYRIIKGSGSTWTKGSAAGLTIVANGACSKFTGIEIDGNAVSSGNYTVSSGSTVITLKPDYLNKLTAGEHTITVLYTDGGATGTFTIAEKPAETTDKDTTSPATGDNSNITLWAALLLVSGAGVTGIRITIFNKKRRNVKAK